MTRPGALDDIEYPVAQRKPESPGSEQNAPLLADDSGSKVLAAGGPCGPGPEPPIVSGRGALPHWDGGGTLIHAVDIEGANSRGHEPTEVRPEARSWDSDGRRLHIAMIARLEKPTGPRHSTPPNGVVRGHRTG